jgi:hypothetical protein
MLSSWFYPKRTADLGRDRNARTVQFSCFLLVFAVGAVAVLNVIAREPLRQTPLLLVAVVGLVAATVINRAGKWEWAARIAILAVLFTAILLVFEARDGFRSTAMLVFPMMLLLSVMLLDRASYVITGVSSWWRWQCWGSPKNMVLPELYRGCVVPQPTIPYSLQT